MVAIHLIKGFDERELGRAERIARWLRSGELHVLLPAEDAVARRALPPVPRIAGPA